MSHAKTEGRLITHGGVGSPSAERVIDVSFAQSFKTEHSEQ